MIAILFQYNIPMTKQKFYELCVLKTFELAETDDKVASNIEFDKLGDIKGLSFNQIMMRYQLLGLNKIPKKEKILQTNQIMESQYMT